MRLFIAVTIPLEIKDKISRIEDYFKKCQINAKWVEPKNVHFTLKFLGDVEDGKLKGISEAMRAIGAAFIPFSVILHNFGFFPSQRRPRVFYISALDSGALAAVAMRLEKVLEEQGFPPEGRFQSHVTIARIKDAANLESLFAAMKDVSIQEAITVNTITLFKSTLTSSGPVYEEIFKAPLGK